MQTSIVQILYAKDRRPIMQYAFAVVKSPTYDAPMSANK